MTPVGPNLKSKEAVQCVAQKETCITSGLGDEFCRSPDSRRRNRIVVVPPSADETALHNAHLRHVEAVRTYGTVLYPYAQLAAGVTVVCSVTWVVYRLVQEGYEIGEFAALLGGAIASFFGTTGGAGEV